MRIYVDGEHKCHIQTAEGRRAFDVPFFDGKCAEFVEGYRYVPEGEAAVTETGFLLKGEAVSPWKRTDELMACQGLAERLSGEHDEEIAALIQEVYLGDIEMIGE